MSSKSSALKKFLIRESLLYFISTFYLLGYIAICYIYPISFLASPAVEEDLLSFLSCGPACLFFSESYYPV